MAQSGTGKEGMAGTGRDYKGTETPAYSVEMTDGTVEVRRYPPHLAAEVTVTGPRDAALGAGFRILAGYIFGGNAGRARIAMTTPVRQDEPDARDIAIAQTGSDQAWTVQFMMPARDAPDPLPTPVDARIRLVAVPARRVVALTFPGIATTAGLQARTGTLRAWAAARSLTPQGSPQFLFYDSPFALPWNRRNEVAFDLD